MILKPVSLSVCLSERLKITLHYSSTTAVFTGVPKTLFTFALVLHYYIWLKKIVTLCHPITSKTKTNVDSLLYKMSSFDWFSELHVSFVTGERLLWFFRHSIEKSLFFNITSKSI